MQRIFGWRQLWPFLFLVLIMLSISGEGRADPDRLAIDNLNKDERTVYVTCKKKNFLEASCLPLFRKICMLPANRDNWTCLGREFSECKSNEFAGPHCSQVLKTVCDASKDRYDYACERYRYETCSQSFFAGDACQNIRAYYELTELENVVDGFRQQRLEDVFSDQVLSNDLTLEILALDRQAKDRYCQMGRVDRSHPAQCSMTMAIGWDEFQKIYERFDGDAEDIPFPQPENPNQRLRRVDLYTALLQSGGPQSAWDALAAEDQWLFELDRVGDNRGPKELPVLRKALESLVQFGDDSLFTSFLFVEASQEDDMTLRRLAIRGLAERNYDTGLAILALLQALRSSDLETRAFALRGVARRYARQLQSAQNDPLAQKKLGSLLACGSLGADPSIYASVTNLDQLSAVDLSERRYLCSIGLGARLRQLKSAIFEEFHRIANDRQSPEVWLEATIEGLPKMSVSTAELNRSIESASQILLFTSSSKLAQAATEAVLTMMGQGQDLDTEAVSEKLLVRSMSFLQRYFSLIPGQGSQGLNQDRDQIKPLDQMLALLESSQVLSTPSAGLDVAGILSRECIQNPNASFPDILRLTCFKYTRSVDFTLVAQNAVLPVLSRVLSSDTSVLVKETALDLLASRRFYFRAEDEGPNCTLRLSLGGDLQAFVERKLQEQDFSSYAVLARAYQVYLERFAFDDDPFIESCKIRETLHQPFLARLQQKGIPQRVKRLLQEVFPELPAKAWFDAYKRENPITLIEPFTISLPEQKTLRAYRLQTPYREAIKAKFRVLDPDVLLVRLYLFSDFERLAHLVLFDRLDFEREDLREQVWGMKKPSVFESVIPGR